MGPGMRVAQLLNVAFDMCAWEVLGSLINGCTIVLRGSKAEDWRKCLSSVDVVISTPTILAAYDPAQYPNIRVVATAGEPCSLTLADRWARAGVAFHNCCGPTEVRGRSAALSVSSEAHADCISYVVHRRPS